MNRYRTGKRNKKKLEKKQETRRTYDSNQQNFELHKNDFSRLIPQSSEGNLGNRHLSWTRKVQAYKLGYLNFF